MKIYSNCLSKEDLLRAADRVPLNQNVMITLKHWGKLIKLRKGRLHNKKAHGSWAYSFYWTDGQYMEYLWLLPKFDSAARKIHTIELLK